MQYEVRAVPDDRLPEGTDWALVRVPDHTYLFIKQARFADPEGLCALLSTSWRARVAVGSIPHPLSA